MTDTVEISRKLLNEMAWAIVELPRKVKHQGWGKPDLLVCRFCKHEGDHTPECITLKARNVLNGERK